MPRKGLFFYKIEENWINNKITDEHIDNLPDGWFSRENCDTYRELFSNVPINGKVIEIGSYLGRSIMSVSDIIEDRNLNVSCVDMWNDCFFLKNTYEGEKIRKTYVEGQFFNDFNKNISSIDRHITVVKEGSCRASHNFKDDTYDLIFVDGDHSSESVRLDIVSYLPKLKIGGVLAGHDYQWGSVSYSVDMLLDNISVTSKGKMLIWKFIKT